MVETEAIVGLRLAVVHGKPDLICPKCLVSLPESLPVTCPNCQFKFPYLSSIQKCVDAGIVSQFSDTVPPFISHVFTGEFLKLVFEEIAVSWGERSLNRNELQSIAYDVLVNNLSMKLPSEVLEEVLPLLWLNFGSIHHDIYRMLRRGFNHHDDGNLKSKLEHSSAAVMQE